MSYAVDVRFTFTIAFAITEAHFFKKQLLESFVTLFLPRLTAPEAIGGSFTTGNKVSKVNFWMTLVQMVWMISGNYDSIYLSQ